MKKNAGKMPSFQFYPADWRKDPAVQSLDFQTRGIWFEILCLMHESEERGVLLLNGQTMPEEALARLLGLDNQILTTTLTTLLTYGVAKRRQSDGAIFSKRMVLDEELCKTRRSAGKMGGNPVLLNQKSTTQVNQKATPSSSSSSSSSTSVVKSTPSAPPPVESRHHDFIQAYTKAWESRNHTKYGFESRDAKAVQTLLKLTPEPASKLMESVEWCWRVTKDDSWADKCAKAADTLRGFCENFNAIQAYIMRYANPKPKHPAFSTSAATAGLSGKDIGEFSPDQL